MKRMIIALSVLGLAGAMAGIAAADEITRTTTSESVTVTSDQPIDAAVITSTPVPVVTILPPAEEQKTQEQTLMGTVQSVDRRNQNIVLQDSDGKNIGISCNNNVHFYRRGQEIGFRDVEPNDHIRVHVASES